MVAIGRKQMASISPDLVTFMTNDSESLHFYSKRKSAVQTHARPFANFRNFLWQTGQEPKKQTVPGYLESK